MSELAPILFAELLDRDQVVVVSATAVRGKSMLVVFPAHQAPRPVVVEAEPRPPLPPLPSGPPWQVQVVFLLRPFLIVAALLGFATLLYLFSH